MTKVSDAALAAQRRAEAERRRAAEAREAARRKAAEAARAQAAAAAARAKAKPRVVARDEMSVGVGRALREGAKKQLLSGAPQTGAPIFRSAANPAPPAPAPASVDASASTTIGPGGVSANAQVGAQFVVNGPGGVGASGSVTLDADFESNVVHEDGFATFTIQGSTSVTAAGELDLRAVSIGGSVTAGAEGSYTVRMSDEDFERMTAGEIPVPNPLNPETIPDGGSVRLDQSHFMGTALQMGFEHHGLELGIDSSSTESEGTSLLVERHGDDVQVTAGPTETLETNTRVSLGYGPVSLSVGVTNELDEFNLRTATFDLSSNAGAEAFAEFAQSGEVPEENVPGVSDAAFIQTTGLVSSNDVDLDLGPINLDLGGYTNTGNNVLVTYPDGTSESTFDARYANGPLLTFNAQYDAEGNVIAGSENVTLKFDIEDEGLRQAIAEAFSGDLELATELAQDDGSLQITLDSEQLASLQEKAREAQEANMTPDTMGVLQDLADAETPWEAALALGRKDQGGLVYDLFGLWLDTGQGSYGLPGSVTD